MTASINVRKTIPLVLLAVALTALYTLNMARRETVSKTETPRWSHSVRLTAPSEDTTNSAVTPRHESPTSGWQPFDPTKE
jgi:hypothetical protein